MNGATMEPHGTFWAGNRGLGHVAEHAGQLAYVSTGSNLAHPAKPSQKAFPIRVSKPELAPVHRPIMPGGVLPSGHEQSQHRLRRKTPSGTIDAGYDGSPAQLIPGQPPFKQVILPVDPWHELPSHASISSTHHSDLSSYSFQSIIPDPTVGARNTVPLARSLSFSTGLSSIEPSFNLGSGRHDHERQHGFARILERLDPPQTAYQPPQALHMPGYYPLLARSPQGITQHPFAEPFIGDLEVPRRSTDPFTPGDGLGSSFVQPHHLAFPWPFDGLAHNSNLQGQPSLQPARHPMLAHPMLTGDGAPKQSFDVQGPNPHHFQQKVLAQAHQTYVELMEQRHLQNLHNAKLGPHAGGSSKNFLHPKLPRRFASHPEMPLGTPGSGLYAHMPLASSGMPDIHSRSQSGPFNPSFPGALPRHLGSTSHTPLQESQAATQSTLGQKGKTLVSAARASLEMLCHFCEQNEWKWTDGMILGGCLCYGVEDYEGALEWFSKVLALYPRYCLSWAPPVADR